MKKTLIIFPRFNNHGAGCKGHSNWMLDCEFSDPDERETMTLVLDKHIEMLDREIEIYSFAAKEIA